MDVISNSVRLQEQHGKVVSKDNQSLLDLPKFIKVNDLEEVDMKAVDNLLKNEMSQLSYRDRYLINQDVHGMNVLASTEPNELYSIGLEALDKQLLRANQIHDGDNDDDDQMRQYFYRRLAGILNSPMIKSKDFRSKFARCCCFDPVKAANRIEMYFEIICENFGNEALTRPVRLTDLDKV